MVNKNPELRPSAEELYKHELMVEWAVSLNQPVNLNSEPRSTES